MKLGITSRLDTEQAIRILGKTISYLLSVTSLSELTLDIEIQNLANSRKEILFKNIENRKMLRNKIHYAPLEDFDVDVIVTIGGDGTILRTIHRTDKRVLPINAGIVGFLTEVEEENLEIGLGKLIDEDYFIDARPRLKTEYRGLDIIHAVNEAVIHTAQVAKMRSFRIFIDGFEAETIRADGVIVATPTGSTCYAMSAGSPILDPKVPAFTIVPISSFSLATRPIVVPDSSEIEVRPLDGKPSLLVLDGQQTIETEGRESLYFTRSEKKAEFIRFEQNFYKRVWSKLIGY